MKRSEMVDKMVEYIRGEHSWDAKEVKISLEYAMGIALNLLEMQEKEGMIPPPYYDEFYHDEPECNGMIPEWEPEND